MKISRRNITIIATAIIVFIAVVASGVFGENSLSTFIGSPISKKLTPEQTYNKIRKAQFDVDGERACALHTLAGQHQVINRARSTRHEGSVCAKIINSQMKDEKKWRAGAFQAETYNTVVAGDTAVVEGEFHFITFKRVNGEWKLDNIKRKIENPL